MMLYMDHVDMLVDMISPSEMFIDVHCERSSMNHALLFIITG